MPSSPIFHWSLLQSDCLGYFLELWLLGCHQNCPWVFLRCLQLKFKWRYLTFVLLDPGCVGHLPRCHTLPEVILHWPPSQEFPFPGLYCGVTLPLSQWPLLANSPSSILTYLSSTTWEHGGILWQLGERGDSRTSLMPLFTLIVLLCIVLMWFSPAFARVWMRRGKRLVCV